MLMRLFQLALSMLIERLRRLPPVRVYAGEGLSPQFWLNLGLTWVGYWPGELHAYWLRRQQRIQ